MDFSTMDREEILKNLILIGDRRKFIEAFLGVESSDKLRMEADADEECAICQDKYGTPTSAEYKIQLPCCGKHTMGSKCIETWLRKHNTCPLCRQEFFPECCYKIDEDGNNYFVEDEEEDDDDDDDDEIVYDQQQLDDEICLMHQLCLHLCQDLGLRAPGDLAVHVANELAQRLCHFHIALDCPTHVDILNRAAACVYMASHLTCQPLTMDEITSRIDAGEGDLLTEATLADAYQYLGGAARVDWFVDEELLELLGARHRREVIHRLPRLPFSWRSSEYEAYQSRTWEYYVDSHRGTLGREE